MEAARSASAEAAEATPPASGALGGAKPAETAVAT